MAERNDSYNYIYRHQTSSIKRVPLDVKIEYYFEYIEPHAKAAGYSVAGFIKRAIDEKMYRFDHGVDDLARLKISDEDLKVYEQYIDRVRIREEYKRREEKAEKYAPMSKSKRKKYVEQILQYVQSGSSEQLFSAKEIADHLNAPYPTIQPILRGLMEQGMLETKLNGRTVYYYSREQKEENN